MTISAERVKSLIADHDSRYLMSESTTEGRFHADTAAALRIALAVIEPSEETVRALAQAYTGYDDAAWVELPEHARGFHILTAHAALSALAQETK